MQALRDQRNYLIHEAPSISRGTHPRFGDGWYMYDANGQERGFTIDDNYNVVEFDVAIKPIDYEVGKYTFENGVFVLNPDWKSSSRTLQDYLDKMQQDIADYSDELDGKITATNGRVDAVSNRVDENEEALCDLDETYAQRVDDVEEALCELSEQ